MDIFEQADAFTPSRAVLQEEEEAATTSSVRYLRPAVCVWNRRLLRQLYPKGLSCGVLVVATCPTSCALLHALPGKQLIGSVLSPGVSLAGNSLSPAASPGEPLPSDRVCCVYRLGTDAAGTAGDVILVCCQYEVARERAPAWARAVLGQVAYGHAVFLGAMAAEQFRGQGDASQEELIFSLRTRTVPTQQQQHGGRQAVPLLPAGTVVGGLTAALLSDSQVRALPAELLVMVEMVMEGRAALVEALAAALSAILHARGAVTAATALSGSGLRVAARRALGLGAAVSDVYA